jgi:hypothetical protein
VPKIWWYSHARPRENTTQVEFWAQHNGMAKRAIGTITNMARMKMLHAAIHWPDATDATQWPMAEMHERYLYNHMPHLETGISPVDLLTKMRWEQKKFHDCYVWGCPV